MNAVPYSGPDAPPTAATSRWPTARSSSPGGVVGRQLGEELLDGPEAERQVVAVVAVAEHRIEAGERGGMAVDRRAGPPKGSPEVSRVDGGRLGRRRRR